MTTQNAVPTDDGTRKLQFTFGNAVYLSNNFTTLRNKVLELGAHRTNGEAGTGVDIKQVIGQVDPAVLIALSVDHALIDLDFAASTSTLLSAAMLAVDRGEQAEDDEAWDRIVESADEILAEAGLSPIIREEDPDDETLAAMALAETYGSYYPMEDQSDGMGWPEEPELDGLGELVDPPMDKPEGVVVTATEELWIGVPEEPLRGDVVIGVDPESGEELTVAQLEATRSAPDHTPQVGDRILTPDFPGWDGSLVVEIQPNERFPVRATRPETGNAGLFTYNECRVIPDPILPQALPAGYFEFAVGMETPGRLDRLMARIAATMVENRVVELGPANNRDLPTLCFYVTVPK